MVNPNTLIDAIVTAWKSSADVVAILGSASKITPYYFDMGLSSGTGVNLEQQIQNQTPGTIMVCWVGTRTGQFAKTDTIRHDMAAYLKPGGKIADLFIALREGVCTSSGMKFKLTQVDPSVRTPEEMSCKPLSRFVSQNYGIYDFAELNFTLTERGVDN
jgi:hypothetical protein